MAYAEVDCDSRDRNKEDYKHTDKLLAADCLEELSYKYHKVDVEVYRKYHHKDCKHNLYTDRVISRYARVFHRKSARRSGGEGVTEAVEHGHFAAAEYYYQKQCKNNVNGVKYA